MLGAKPHELLSYPIVEGSARASYAGLRVRTVSVLAALVCLLAVLAAGRLPAANAGPRAVPSNPGPRVLHEEIDRRTAMSRSYLLADGSHQTRIALVPMNFKDAHGQWQPIDTTLVGDGTGGLQPRAGTSKVTLPASLNSPVNFSDASGRWVSFQMADAAADAARSAQGSRATYSRVRPGVDASYLALSTGVKETLTLADASAPDEYSFIIDHSDGLVPRLAPDGAVSFEDADGTSRFSMPAPTVQEHGADAPTADHVHYRLSADHATLTVVIDPSWLAQAQFPVELDPTVYSSAQSSCTLANGTLASTADCNASTMRVGNDGSHVQRAVLRFTDLTSLFARTATVSAAELKLYGRTMSNVASDQLFDVSGLGKRLTTGATWNTYDGVNSWTTPGGDTSTTAPPVTSLNVKPAYIPGIIGPDVTALVQSWIRDSTKNNGLLLRAHDETATNLLTVDGPTGANQLPLLEIVSHDGPGLAQDQTFEKVGLDDRSEASVNVATGNLALSANDIHLTGVAGLDLNVSRTFNGQSLGAEGLAGSAWADSINGASLRMDFSYLSHSHVLYANGGAVYRFENTAANWSTVGSPTLATPPGINASMVENSTDNGVTVTFNQSGIKWIYGDDLDGYTQLLTQIKDAHGNHIDLSYSDPSDPRTLSSITDSRGQVLTVNRDSSGTITGLTDSQGRHWGYGVAATHHVLGSYTDPTSHTTSYSYDTSDPTNVWDKLVKVTDGRGHDVKFEYDGTLGDNSKVTKITRVVDGTTANDVSWTFNYNATGTGHGCSDTSNGRTVETDPRGKLTTYCFNASGQVVETWDALDRTQTKGYNAQANVTSAADAAGGTGNPLNLSYATDSTHNLKGGTEPSGETFGLTYCVTSGTSGNKCSGGVAGDMAMYKPQSFTNEQSATTNFDYNAAGDVSRVNDAQSPTVASLNLAYNTTAPDPTDGTLKSSTDANNNTTTYSYTNHNLTTITPPSSSTLIGATTLTYDAENRVKTVKDGLNTTATLAYDGEDHVTSVAYSNGRGFAITYDANGNPTQRLETLNGTTVNTTNYGYDNLNRRTSETFPGPATNTYGYDKIGNLTSLSDAGGKTTYAYDDINRLSTLTSPKTGTADCVASPTSCDSITYAYQDLGNGVFTSGATSSQTATYPGNLTQVIQANASGRPTSDAIKDAGGTVLQGQSFAYGATQRALIQSISQQPANTTTAYTYGTGAGSGANIGALREAQTKNSSGTVTDDWTYTTDLAGNRTRRVHTSGGTTATTSYAYNAANELCWSVTSASSNACGTVPTGATTYTYDHAGNQTTGNTYDALSRLTATTGVTGSLSYLSPGNTELIAVGSTGLQNGLLGLLRQVPSTGSATSYTRQPDGTPIAQRTTSTKQYLLGDDQLGSITALADNNTASLTRTYSYDPDGNRSTATPGGGTPPSSDLGYASGYTLPGGLIHYGARYYNPSLARWTQQDPLNQITSLQQANRYAYVGGDPINSADPAGLFSIGFSASIAGIKVGGSVDTSGHVGLSYGATTGSEAGISAGASTADVESGSEVGASAAVGGGYGEISRSGHKTNAGFGIGLGLGAEISYTRTRCLNC